MKKAVNIFIIISLLCISGTWLFAQQNVSAPQKYALVIGNGTYTNFGTLRNPVNDANDVAAALQGLGWTVDKVLNGSLGQMESAAIRLKNRLTEAGNSSYGFFFYAGHGVQMDGVNYLIPSDANIPDKNFLRERALSVQIMLGMLNDAKNALNIVVLDACRDFPVAWTKSVDRGLAVIAAPPADSIIMYATGAGKTASDGTGKNGLFTTHLLENMKNPNLEVNDVFRRTMGAVARASNNEQRPALYTDFSETAYLGQRPTSNAQVQPAQSVQPQQTTTQPSAANEAKNVIQRGMATQEMRTNDLAAASPFLAIGRKVRIANIANGEEVEVWITGRIASSVSRIVDLSPSTALALDIGYEGPVVINGEVASGNPVIQRGMATQEMPDILSAAHPSIPIGSRVRVTNTANGKEVEVWITGRIAPSSDRIIDLSPSAAQALGLGSRGTVLVSSSK